MPTTSGLGWIRSPLTPILVLKEPWFLLPMAAVRPSTPIRRLLAHVSASHTPLTRRRWYVVATGSCTLAGVTNVPRGSSSCKVTTPTTMNLPQVSADLPDCNPPSSSAMVGHHSATHLHRSSARLMDWELGRWVHSVQGFCLI